MGMVRKLFFFALVSLLVLALFVAIFWIIPNSINTHTSVETGEPVLALTFDDGPYPPWTTQLLDLLAREDVKATFYLAGMNLEQHMELGRRIIAEGHEVGNHLYNGDPLTFASPARARRVFEHCDALLREIGATGPITVRQGRGAGGPTVGYLVWRDERQQVLASAGSNDWLRPGWRSNDCPLRLLPCPTQEVDEIVAGILPDIRPGAIILLHDGYDDGPGADRSGTLAAAEIIIRHARERGYRFVTVSELLALDAP